MECNPVAMSYAYLSREETVLFIQKAVLEDTAAASLAAKGVKVEEYDTVTDYLKTLPEGRKVMADQRQCSYALYRILSGRQTVVEKKNPTELLKAVKNPVELAHMEDIYLKDSVALTRFIYWLKTNIGKIEITEVTAADHLEMLRRQIPEFLDLSFPTIAGYGENAAMMHYEATPDSCAVLKPEGMLWWIPGDSTWEVPRM